MSKNRSNRASSNSSRSERKKKPRGKKNNKNVNFSAKQSTSVATPPRAFGITKTSMAPRIAGTASSTRVKRSELLYEVIHGSETFQVQNFCTINPGVETCFPWLSKMAALWEQYRFTKLQYEYVPTAPTSRAGTVIMSPSYDAADPVITTERQACNMEGTISFPVWQPRTMSFNIKRLDGAYKHHYTRTGATAGDLKTYDVGSFTISTTGMADSSAIGKVWVHYEIELVTPQDDNLSSFQGPTSTSMFRGDGWTITASSAYQSIPFNPAIEHFNPLRISIIDPTTSSAAFNFPQGCYRLQYGASIQGGGVAEWAIFLRINGSPVPGVDTYGPGSASYASTSDVTSVQQSFGESLVFLKDVDLVQVVLQFYGGASTAVGLGTWLVASLA